MWKQRNDDGYQEFRRIVLRRDKRKCQMPGCKHTRHLQVHHIRKYSNHIYLRTEPSNGITLCIRCHKEIKGKEHNFVDLFDSIARRNEQNRRK